MPGAARNEAGPQSGRRKGGRRFLIGSSAVVPLILTIPNRPAFASGKKCTASLAMSARNSTPLGGSKKGIESGPCGNAVNNWQTTYPQLQSASLTSGITKLPAQVTGIDYLSNTTYVAGSSGTIFTFPSALNGVSFSTNPSGNFDLSTVLGGGVQLVVSVTFNGQTQTQHDPGGNNGFFAQAAAAVLNAATFGSTAFGYTDVGLIAQVNGVFAAMQAQALTYESGNPSAHAQDVANNIIQLITGGGGFTGEISTLNTLNSQSSG